MKIIILIFLFELLVSCSTDNSIVESYPNKENYDTLEYVQGEIGFGLKDSISLMELANYIYSLDSISIKEIASFQYYTILPPDSMQIIKSALELEPYILDGTVYTSYIESDRKIIVEFWVKNFNSQDRKDWIRFKKRFLLTHSPYNFQLGLLKVEIGREEEWVNKLLNVDLFRFVELNYITHTY